MTRDVLTASPSQELVDLIPAFSDGGRHHLPVVDADRRLVGILTQSDVVAALFVQAWKGHVAQSIDLPAALISPFNDLT
jgi:CBS-domain-containing membrane protein